LYLFLLASFLYLHLKFFIQYVVSEPCVILSMVIYRRSSRVKNFGKITVKYLVLQAKKSQSWAWSYQENLISTNFFLKIINFF
jgi:hypothetical protein